MPLALHRISKRDTPVTPLPFSSKLHFIEEEAEAQRRGTNSLKVSEGKEGVPVTALLGP